MGQMELRQQTVQLQHISHEQLQAAQILQLNAEELEDYLRAQYEENPALELDAPKEAPMSLDMLRYVHGWSSVRPRETDFDPLSEAENAGREDPAFSSLGFFLRDQLARASLDEEEKKLVTYLILLLDEDGFLPEDISDFTGEYGIEETALASAIGALQSFEPAGVGARSAGERLLLQLSRKRPVNEAESRLLLQSTDALAKKKFSRLAERYAIGEEELHTLLEEIAALDPDPCADFRSERDPALIVPDFYIVDDEERNLHILMNGSAAASVSVNGYYEELLARTEDEETGQYLRAKLRQASWTVTNVKRRGTLLMKCAKLICSAQRAFFLTGKETAIRAMTVSEGAEILQIHISVMSRALRDKYLECRYGVFPLKAFFCKAVNGTDFTEHQIKNQLLSLLRRESPQKPLSDAQLTERLNAMGYVISRRTVNKYRTELGIGSAFERKSEKT